MQLWQIYDTRNTQSINRNKEYFTYLFVFPLLHSDFEVDRGKDKQICEAFFIAINTMGDKLLLNFGTKFQR